MSADTAVRNAMGTLLTELLQGLAAPPCFVLNPGDPGLLPTLERLSARAASAPAADGGPSIAAHVDHLRYGFELLNRWAGGDDPFGRRHVRELRMRRAAGAKGDAIANRRKSGYARSKQIVDGDVLEDVFEPTLGFFGPRYCCHARMRRPISSFEMVRFASESASPRSTMT